MKLTKQERELIVRLLEEYMDSPVDLTSEDEFENADLAERLMNKLAVVDGARS